MLDSDWLMRQPIQTWVVLTQSHDQDEPIRPPLKTSLFPVQRVAEIMAIRAAAKSFFFSVFSFFGKKIVKIILEIFFFENEKKKVPVGPHRLTRPLDRKQHFF